MRMGCGIRTKGQLVLLCRGPQFVEDKPRLNASVLFAMIEFQNLIAVLGKIENDGKVAALTAQACTASTGENRSSMHTGKTHGRDRVFYIAWNYDPDRNLPVIGSVRGVKRTISIAETNFSFDHFLECSLKLQRLRKMFVLGRMM